MNKNVVIVLVGGFLVAILVAVLVQASLGGKAEDNGGVKTEVLVAARDLPLGTNLASGDLKWQTWPGQPFTGAIVREKDQKPEDALTGRLTARVAADQPVLSSYTFKEGRGNIVAATLEKGMRAVAIPVAANTMAGGFVSPGDYVDVILTHRVHTDGSSSEAKMLVNEYASETILKNVKVLAVDQEAARDEDSAKIAKTVTVEVNTAGAEKVALASKMGDMTLSLRGLGDDSDKNTSEATTDIQASRVMQNLAIMENGGTGGAIKVYNGDTVIEQHPRGMIVGDQPATEDTGEGQQP